MSNARRGLPLTSSRVEKIFPKLTPGQIGRVAGHGHMRSVQPGEVLIEQGDTSVPFFVVITGEVEIVRPFGAHETLVTVHGPSEFSGQDLAGRAYVQVYVDNIVKEIETLKSLYQNKMLMKEDKG